MDQVVYTYPDPYVCKKKLKPIEYIINENGCHVCIRETSLVNGYPQVTRYRKTKTLHRYVFELLKGHIPKGMDIMHSCDNRRCFNPEHLSIGTRQDNMIDMVSKKRSNNAKGEAHRSSKLLEYEVWEILADPRPVKVIALHYGVVGRSIYSIKKGETWNHVWRGYHGQKAENSLQLHS